MSAIIPADLFGESQTAALPKIDVLPVSVIEVGPQLQLRRETGGHDSTSSRADYSHFPQEVASLCLELFLRDCSSIFDPFAGWGERAAYARLYGKQYTGIDINQAAIESARAVYGVSNTLGDSMSAPIPRFDGLLTCPPYWNLEQYSDAGIDGSPTYRAFLYDYATILQRCYTAARSGATFCLLVGDWRDNGSYYDLAHQTRAILYGCGATPIDEVCVSRARISKVKVMLPQAVRLGYTVKVHETLLVFRKAK